MKSFNQFINEALNRPYLWKKSYSPRDDEIAKIDANNIGTPLIWTYIFATALGDTIEVDVKYEHIDQSITIMFSLYDKGDYIEDLTGRGEPFRVFATVIDIAKHFVKNANFTIKKIKFSASKGEGPGRAKLYHRFAKRFGTESGYGKVAVKTYSHDVEYILSRG